MMKTIRIEPETKITFEFMIIEYNGNLYRRVKTDKGILWEISVEEEYKELCSSELEWEISKHYTKVNLDELELIYQRIQKLERISNDNIST